MTYKSRKFHVPDTKKINLIIDTDAKNEADDQYAVAHALLSEKLNVMGIVASHFSERRVSGSMHASYEECLKMADLLEYPRDHIFMGNQFALNDLSEYEESEGVRFIIDAAHKSRTKLNIAVLGPLTNVAAALLKDESIADNIAVYYTGGRINHENGEIVIEANSRNDIKAFNIVMDKCKELYLVPMEEYMRLSVSISELEYRLSGKNHLADYLFNELVEVNNEARSFAQGESWVLGDSTVIGALLNSRCCESIKTNRYFIDENGKAVNTDQKMVFLKNFDQRYIMEDFFAKIALF